MPARSGADRGFRPASSRSCRNFTEAHRGRFGFATPERPITVEAVAVEVIARRRGGARGPACLGAQPAPLSRGSGGDVDAAAGRMSRRSSIAPTLQAGDRIAGPALIREANRDHSGRTRMDGRDDRARSRPAAAHGSRARRGSRSGPTRPIPVLLEMFNNLFMNVAEQTGAVLQNTSLSVNIKERLDFCCAVFDADGDLVANAPHVPVHLGAMGESVRTVLRHRRGTLKPGDVVALNNPYNGGTHLPDVTVVTPVFDDERKATSLLRRQPRPPRRHRRSDPGLDAVCFPHSGGRRRGHRRLPPGRWRTLPGSRVSHAACFRKIPGAQPGRECRRYQGPGRSQREGRAGAEAHRDASTAGTSCTPT